LTVNGLWEKFHNVDANFLLTCIYGQSLAPFGHQITPIPTYNFLGGLFGGKPLLQKSLWLLADTNTYPQTLCAKSAHPTGGAKLNFRAFSIIIELGDRTGRTSVGIKNAGRRVFQTHFSARNASPFCSCAVVSC